MLALTNLRRAAHLTVLAALGSAAALGAALGIEACGGTETGGRRIVLDTRVALAADGSAFGTAAGWDVTLTRAVVSTGAFYYFDGAPPVVAFAPESSRQLAPESSRRLVLGLLGLGEAQAHPGHYHTGDALGQMLEPWSVDLLAGPATLPAGDGVTGTYRSARFSFGSPPAGPLAGELGAHAALVEGVAARAEALVRFRAVADLADIARSAAEGNVDGCEFDELDVEGSGVVTLTVHPKAWFDLVDFAALTPSGADAPVEFSPGSQPQVAFAQGLAQLSAYEFSFSTP